MVPTLWQQTQSYFINKGLKMGTAVQNGDKIIISSKYGGVVREFYGRLICYANGYLTYIPINGSHCVTYVGI